jgi:hypothetical protein
MSTIYDNISGQAGGARALALVPGPQPWYATAPTAPPDRRELEDAHTRVLAQAVGDHMADELVRRPDALAAALARSA